MSVAEDATSVLLVLETFERESEPITMENLSGALAWRADRLEAALDYGETHGWIRSLAVPPATMREHVMIRDGGRRIVDAFESGTHWASVASSR